MSVVALWISFKRVCISLTGFVLAGFHNNGPKTEMFDLSQVTEICQKTMVRLISKQEVQITEKCVISYLI